MNFEQNISKIALLRTCSCTCKLEREAHTLRVRLMRLVQFVAHTRARLSAMHHKQMRLKSVSQSVHSRVGLNLNFEFESAHELLINLNLNSNSTFAKSVNLNMNFDFLKSMNLNSNLKIKNKMNGSNQCRR